MKPGGRAMLHSIQNEAFADCDTASPSQLRVSECVQVPGAMSQMTGSNDSFDRGTAVPKAKISAISTCLGHQVTQMARIQMTSHRVFHDNIPPGLKTTVSPEKLTQGQAPRVFLSCASGAAGRVWRICRPTASLGES